MLPTSRWYRSDQSDLNHDFEEADIRIIPHIAKVFENGCKRIVLLSNYTDVVVLLLYYLHHFFSIGLLQLWVRFGTSEKTRHIPLHKLG